MSMTQARANEIAFDLFRHQAMRESIRFDGLNREFGRLAKETGLPQEELREFFVGFILPEMIAQGLTASGTVRFQYRGPVQGK